MQSDGTPWRPLVHIGDIIHAFIATLQAPREAIHNQAFNVGRTAENYQIRQVANIVAEVVPNCEVSFASGASADIRDYRVTSPRPRPSCPATSPTWTVKPASKSSTTPTKRPASRKSSSSTRPTFYRLKTVRGLQARGIIDTSSASSTERRGD